MRPDSVFPIEGIAFKFTLGYSSQSVSLLLDSFSQSPGLLVAAVLAVGLLTAFFAILVPLVRHERRAPLRRSFPDLSPHKYAPLARLLEESDFRFVQSQSGGSRQILQRLRRSRCAIVREYLAELETDFNALHAAATELLVFAPPGYPDLAWELTRLRWEFFRNLWQTRAALALSRFGWSGFDPRRVVGSLTQIQQHVSRLSTWASEQPLR